MSNGFFINRDVAKKLKELGISHIQLSLEGTKEINDSIRGKGSFEKITKAARILVQEDIPVVLSFTSNRKNYKDFEKVVEIGKEIGVNVVWTDRMILFGHGKNLKKDLLTPNELKKFYQNIYKISKRLRDEGGKTFVPLSRTLYFLCSGLSEYICHAGDNGFAIMPNGDVFPCRRLPIKIGNLTKQTILEIWYSSNLAWDLRNKNIINSLCKKCKFFDKCFGGAKCISYGYWGTPFAPDPQCWIGFNELPKSKEINKYEPEKSDDVKLSWNVVVPNIGFLKLGSHLEIKNNEQFYVYENNFEKINDSIVLVDINPSINPNIFIKEKNKNKTFFISFKLKEKDLNHETGQKILNILEKLSNAKIKFNICKPIPRCVLGSNFEEIDNRYKIPNSCKDCLYLFKINNGNIELCDVVNKKGSDAKYMNDSKQIHEYFQLFHEKLEPSNKCKSCIFFMRGKCDALCFRN